MHKAGKLAALTLALIMLVIPIGMAQKCGGKDDVKPESEPALTTPKETTPAAATSGEAPESQPADEAKDMGAEDNAEDAGGDADAGPDKEKVFMPATKAGPFMQLEGKGAPKAPNAPPNLNNLNKK